MGVTRGAGPHVLHLAFPGFRAVVYVHVGWTEADAKALITLPPLHLQVTILFMDIVGEWGLGASWGMEENGVG